MKNIIPYSLKTIFTIGLVNLLVVGYAQNTQQPYLGHRTAPILTVGKLKFKDLNKNGKLDPYEDWRLPVNTRIQDLVSQMTLDEKAGMMLISTTRMAGDFAFEQGKPKGPIINGFNEEDLVQNINMFSRKPLPYPLLSASGTTKGVKEKHLRNFILRANTDAKTMAEWSNNLQQLTEETRLGIPAIVASNPRNHITRDNSVGLSVGATVFSKWPGELGLSAMRDLKLTRQFAEIAAQEWKAVGLRKGYQYMADLATEPRWQRIEGTFGEDADWAASMMFEVVQGFQGKKLNPNSVALTTKHFPGGGPQVEGQDPHFDFGKDQHYPGGMFEYHLKPFIAAIKAGTSSMMPYYAKPIKTEFEEVGFAYSKAIITDLLRKKLGFQGIVNSDTGPIEMMPWGVEGLSILERYQKSLDAGVDLYSGSADPSLLIETVKKGLVSEKRIDESVTRILRERFELGLFENPYVDAEAAQKIVGNANFQKVADIALRKSIVVLKNEKQTLPIKAKTKVYFETYLESGKNNPHYVYQPKSSADYAVEFVKTPEEADQVIVWLMPGTAGGLFSSRGAPIDLRLSKNLVDVEYVNKILKSGKSSTLCINFTSPWVMEELAPSNALLATFGTTPEAVLDIVLGKFKPSGKLPFSIPASSKAVLENLSDVPGFMKKGEYAQYKSGDGLQALK